MSIRVVGYIIDSSLERRFAFRRQDQKLRTSTPHGPIAFRYFASNCRIQNSVGIGSPDADTVHTDTLLAICGPRCRLEGDLQLLLFPRDVCIRGVEIDVGRNDIMLQCQRRFDNTANS
jgi:hypothetical protein